MSNSHLRHILKVLLDLGIAHSIVLQVAVEVAVVSLHVDKTVTGKTEQDGLLLATDLTFLCLAYGGSDGVTALGSRDDALGTGKQQSGFEALKLRNVDAVHHLVFDELRHDGASAIVA